MSVGGTVSLVGLAQKKPPGTFCRDISVSAFHLGLVWRRTLAICRTHNALLRACGQSGAEATRRSLARALRRLFSWASLSSVNARRTSTCLRLASMVGCVGA